VDLTLVISILAVAPLPHELLTTYLQLAIGAIELSASEPCDTNKPAPSSAAVASFLICEIFIRYFSYRYCEFSELKIAGSEW
jgi:hypothetical protein